jgi:hypothetical protein
VAEHEGAAGDQQLLWGATGVVGIALVGEAAPGGHIGPAGVGVVALLLAGVFLQAVVGNAGVVVAAQVVAEFEVFQVRQFVGGRVGFVGA